MSRGCLMMVVTSCVWVLLATPSHCAEQGNSAPHAPGDITVQKGAVRRKLPLVMASSSDRPQTLWYGWRELAYGSPERLFVSDRSAKVIHVLSARDGTMLTHFGRGGKGPGEFLSPGRIRALGNGRVAVLDVELRRITVFDSTYNVLRTITVKHGLDDFAFLNDDTLLTSSYRLENGFKPLRMVRAKDGSTIASFGAVVEPQENLLRRLTASPFAKADAELYSYGWMTRFVYLVELRSIFLSQAHPYFVLLCRLANQQCRPVNIPAPFSTYDNMEYKIEGQSRSATIRPSGQVVGPMVVGNIIALLILDAGLRRNYLDCYTLSGAFKQRFEFPPLPTDLSVLSATISEKAEMFLLVRDKNDVNWIERFDLRLGW